MSDTKTMTTQEFAKKAGVSASTVSKWIRSGKVEATKQGGKWMICEDQLEKVASSSASSPKSVPAKTQKPTKSDTKSGNLNSNKKAYSTEEFSEITYLTIFGVERYLKEGRLTGNKNASGQWEVDASNLEKIEIRHLIR